MLWTWKSACTNISTIEFKSSWVNNHEILILKDGVNTTGSPVTIYVSDPSLVRINNLKYKSKYGESFSFDIDAIEAGEGFIRVNIKGNSSEYYRKK